MTRRRRPLSRHQGAVECRTASAEETHRFGVQLAESIRVPAVVLLRGALGAGKTTLARGIAEGLGVRDPAGVNSPSFTIVNIYEGRAPIYHVDLYRLEGARDLYSIGLADFLDADGVTIVEWSERLAFPPELALTVELEDAGGDCRRIRAVFPRRAGSGRRSSAGRPERRRRR